MKNKKTLKTFVLSKVVLPKEKSNQIKGGYTATDDLWQWQSGN